MPGNLPHGKVPTDAGWWEHHSWEIRCNGVHAALLPANGMGAVLFSTLGGDICAGPGRKSGRRLGLGADRFTEGADVVGVRTLGDALAANKANWDARAVVHSQSTYYDVGRYIHDPRAISGVVAWDRQLLGDVAGMDMLHLQCHIGTDTISWARLGARVVGLDLSPESLRIARDLSERAGVQVEYVVGNVMEADRLVGRQFDIVYASVGILCWVPDVDGWARAAAASLRPGGRLYLRDDHPVIAMLEPSATGPSGATANVGLGVGWTPVGIPHGSGVVGFGADLAPLSWTGDYFSNDAERIDSPYTYTGDAIRSTATVSYQWTHSLGAILTALAGQGLRIEQVEELDWSDWQPFPDMVLDASGRSRLPAGGPRIPLSFFVLAKKA